MRKPTIEVLNRSDTNRVVQAQKIARGWKFLIYCTIRVAKKKALIEADLHLCFRICKHLSRLMGKPTICIGEIKDADQLRGNREADQRLCFRYSDSAIPLLLKSEISSF